jgi:hypothetical protein
MQWKIIDPIVEKDTLIEDIEESEVLTTWNMMNADIFFIFGNTGKKDAITMLITGLH